MKPEILKLVKAAIASGDYPKCGGKLVRVIGGREHYCFMGLICQLYKEQTGNGKWLGDRFYVDPYLSSRIGRETAMEWAGIDPELTHEIIDRNDSSGGSFDYVLEMFE